MTNELNCPSCLAEDGESEEYDRESLDEHHLDVHGYGLGSDLLDEIEETGGVLNGAREKVIEVKRDDLDVDASDIAERVDGVTEIAVYHILDDVTYGELDEGDTFEMPDEDLSERIERCLALVLEYPDASLNKIYRVESEDRNGNEAVHNPDLSSVIDGVHAGNIHEFAEAYFEEREKPDISYIRIEEAPSLDEMLEEDEDDEEDGIEHEQTVYHLKESLEDGGTYHADADCGYVNRFDGNTPNEATKDELDNVDADWSPCSACADEDEDRDSESDEEDEEDDIDTKTETDAPRETDETDSTESESSVQTTEPRKLTVELYEKEWRDVFRAVRHSEDAGDETLISLAEQL